MNDLCFSAIPETNKAAWDAFCDQFLLEIPAESTDPPTFPVDTTTFELENQLDD